MKKILAAIIIIASLTFAGCGGIGSGEEANDGNEAVGGNETESRAAGEVVNLAVLRGPTGMGAVQLIDMTKKYNVEVYEAPTDIAPKLIKGEVDAAALPSNMAAVLYNKTGGEVLAVTPVALGSLYILENRADTATDGAKATESAGAKDTIDGLNRLKGKTIVASGQGGTPEYVLQKVLEDAGIIPGTDLQIRWLASHADVNQKLLSEPGTIAMVPEPFAGVALTKGNAKGGKSNVKMLFDMNSLWQSATGQELPMGVLAVRADFAQNRESDLETLLTDLKKSVEFINGNSRKAAGLIVDKGFLEDENVAEKAVPGCKAVCFGGGKNSAGELAEGREMLKTFNQIMFEISPESLGGSLPGDDMYYIKR